MWANLRLRLLFSSLSWLNFRFHFPFPGRASSHASESRQKSAEHVTQTVTQQLFLLLSVKNCRLPEPLPAFIQPLVIFPPAVTDLLAKIGKPHRGCGERFL